MSSVLVKEQEELEELIRKSKEELKGEWNE
jgi:hypothetical protein